MTKFSSVGIILFFIFSIMVGCNNTESTKATTAEPAAKPELVETPEYFYLRPEVEKAYGYTHAVKIGNDIKISGAVSMDDKGKFNSARKFRTADEKLLQRFGKNFTALRLQL